MNIFTKRCLKIIQAILISHMKYGLFFTIFSYSSLGWSISCKIDVPGRNDSFPLQGGSITVGNELPIGSIIYQQKIISKKDFVNAPHAVCDGKTDVTDRQYLYLTNTPKGLVPDWKGIYPGKVFNTNVPGIGVAIARGSNGLNKTEFQWYWLNRPSVVHIQPWTDLTLYLIKTGNITAGSLDGSSLPTTTIRNDLTVMNGSTVLFRFFPYTFSFSGSLQIISQTCNIPDYTVDLGTWDTVDISSKGSSEWRDASIKMTNCPRFHGYIDNAFNTDHLTGAISGLKNTGNAIGLKLSALYGNIDAANGIVKLEPSDNAAGGVGIQLASGSKDSNTLFNLGNEQRIAVSNSTSTSLTIPLVARYIKTEKRVTPGKADSKVIFTINYY